MRATERKQKEKQYNLPENKKKADLSKNGTAVADTDKFRERHSKLKKLRIDKQTIILVSEEKCTEDYAEKKRRDFRTGSKAHDKMGGLL